MESKNEVSGMHLASIWTPNAEVKSCREALDERIVRHHCRGTLVISLFMK